MKTLMMFFGIALSTAVCAQDIEEGANIVQYDPLFWKDKLKLDEDQCQKIREINGEYYQNLFTAYQEKKDNHTALRKLADQSLMQRNQEIWETFGPKQKKRWKRLWNASMANGQHNES
jgi:hypothetical protein